MARGRGKLLLGKETRTFQAEVRPWRLSPCTQQPSCPRRGRGSPPSNSRLAFASEPRPDLGSWQFAGCLVPRDLPCTARACGVWAVCIRSLGCTGPARHTDGRPLSSVLENPLPLSVGRTCDWTKTEFWRGESLVRLHDTEEHGV